MIATQSHIDKEIIMIQTTEVTVVDTQTQIIKMITLRIK